MVQLDAFRFLTGGFLVGYCVLHKKWECLQPCFDDWCQLFREQQHQFFMIIVVSWIWLEAASQRLEVSRSGCNAINGTSDISFQPLLCWDQFHEEMWNRHALSYARVSVSNSGQTFYAEDVVQSQRCRSEQLGLCYVIILSWAFPIPGNVPPSREMFHPGKRAPIPGNVPPSREMYQPSWETCLYPGKRAPIPGSVLGPLPN